MRPLAGMILGALAWAVFRLASRLARWSLDCMWLGGRLHGWAYELRARG